MATFRLILAIFFAKLTYYSFRLLGRNASHSPGWVALHICPDYLERIKKCPLTICVTGTNGKTTVTNMISDALIDNHYTVSTNRIGSNIAPGIASALTNSISFSGKPIKDACVLEVDERASRLILPYVKPNYLVVTNLFRDSLKRNAHPDYIFSVIDTYTPKETTLILNSDDLCSSRLGETKGNKRIFYGIGKMQGDLTRSINLVSDYAFCPVCHTKLQYNYLRYHHIGNAYCPSCGFHSYQAEYFVSHVDTENKQITVRERNAERRYPLVNTAIFNIYNELTVITTLREIGLDSLKIKQSLEKLSVVDSRLKETKVGNVGVVQAMSKGQSCVSCSRTFDYLRTVEGRKVVILIVDDLYDRKNSVEYIGWIYDSDFEFLADKDIVQIVATGPRCYDHQVRLLLAGVEKEKIVCCEKEMDAVEAFQKGGIDKVFVLYDTSTYNLAMKVKEKVIQALKEAQQ